MLPVPQLVQMTADAVEQACLRNQINVLQGPVASRKTPCMMSAGLTASELHASSSQPCLPKLTSQLDNSCHTSRLCCLATSCTDMWHTQSARTLTLSYDQLDVLEHHDLGLQSHIKVHSLKPCMIRVAERRLTSMALSTLDTCGSQPAYNPHPLTPNHLQNIDSPACPLRRRPQCWRGHKADQSLAPDQPDHFLSDLPSISKRPLTSPPYGPISQPDCMYRETNQPPINQPDLHTYLGVCDLFGGLLSAFKFGGLAGPRGVTM